jgi:hypothetical protein
MPESKRSCAAAFFSALLLPMACQHATNHDWPPPASVAASRAPAASASPSASEPGEAAVTPVADPFATAAPVSAKSIGHTSYVLKIKLEGDLVAAYKPGSHLPLGSRRYRGEIAAYRLACALGLTNVPRALPRDFTASDLRSAFGTPEAAADFDRKALVDASGLVHGALIPWIADYRVVPLEEDSWRAKWQRWLTDPAAVVPPAQSSLAASISTMIVFDYVTANWDRWSGGNVAQAGAQGTLLFVDNDGAFYEHPGTGPLASQLERLRRIVRFSRGFVAAIRALDEGKARAAIGDDSSGQPLLSDRVLAGVEARRKTALATVEARIARAGEAATLAFD